MSVPGLTAGKRTADLGLYDALIGKKLNCYCLKGAIVAASCFNRRHNNGLCRLLEN